MRTEREFRKLLLLLVAFGVAGALLAVQLAMSGDPFGVHRRFVPGGPIAFDASRGDEAAARIFRPVWYRAGRFDTLLVGSSRVREGFDAAAFEALSPAAPRVFNASFDGAGLYELVRHTEDLFAVRPPRLLLVALDFWQFKAGTKPLEWFSERRLRIGANGAPNWLQPLVSFQETSFSLSVLRRSLIRLSGRRLTVGPCRTTSFSSDGFQLESAYDCILGSRQLTQSELVSRTLRSFDATFADFSFWSPLNDPSHPLQRLLRLALAHKTEVVVFTTPVHALHLEVIRRNGRAAQHIRWIGELAQVVEGMREQGAQVRLLSFAGYHEASLERVSDGGSFMEGYYETSHFRPRIGRQIGDCIVGRSCPAGFGREVTGANALEVALRSMTPTAGQQRIVEGMVHLLPERLRIAVDDAAVGK